MNSRDLILTALELAKPNPKKPSQARLRRAISTAYYAMFHAICNTCANSFIGAPSKDRCERAWNQTYRSVDHRKCKEACAKCSKSEYNFPAGIRDFADYFTTMQPLRHRADYDPRARFSRRETIEYIEGAAKAIKRLDSIGSKHKRAFAALIMLREIQK